MSQPLPPHLTRLLVAWSDGDLDALAELMPLVRDDLRQMARRYLNREYANHGLEPSDLVHEFLARVFDRDGVSWKNRAHFFGTAAQSMRRFLVDLARRRNRQKHGGGQEPIPLGPRLERLLATSPSLDLIALDDALRRFESHDPRAAKVVELRFFVGMTVKETAASLEISPATVKRDWEFARLWLYRRLRDDEGPEHPG